MTDKSLIEINQRLTPKGGTSLPSPEDYNDDLQDLETLVNDMLTYRGEAELPPGNMSLEKYTLAEAAMSTCTCNNRTYVDAKDCASRTACSCNIRTTSCSCDIRTTSCACNVRTTTCSCNMRTTICDCAARTQDCACNLRNSTVCHCATRNWCVCQTRGSCNCQTRGTCHCATRGTCNCDARGSCDCDARTGCLCNSRTGEPLDVFG